MMFVDFNYYKNLPGCALELMRSFAWIKMVKRARNIRGTMKRAGCLCEITKKQDITCGTSTNCIAKIGTEQKLSEYTQNLQYYAENQGKTE